MAAITRSREGEAVDDEGTEDERVEEDVPTTGKGRNLKQTEPDNKKTSILRETFISFGSKC